VERTKEHCALLFCVVELCSAGWLHHRPDGSCTGYKSTVGATPSCRTRRLRPCHFHLTGTILAAALHEIQLAAAPISGRKFGVSI